MASATKQSALTRIHFSRARLSALFAVRLLSLISVVLIAVTMKNAIAVAVIAKNN